MTNKIPNAKLDFMDIANNLSVTAFFGIVSLEVWIKNAYRI